MLSAALFDWDGTVVDSGAAHEKSWFLLAKEEGLPITREMFLASFGRTNKFIIPQAYKWTSDPAEIERLGERKEVLYREIVAKMRGDELALPGAVELVKALRKAGIPCGVGSSAPRANIEQLIRQIGLDGSFGALVTAESVTKSKPDPEVFLKGAASLGVDPKDCVVFEDAVHGIEAGRAAGMKTVAVLTTHKREDFEGLADLIVERLDEVTLPGLMALWK
ncbi:MAG TPA: HAD family phosphatase [Opitutales bacterium]|nr:HAD family phosphatase [Opitutales bacterium]